jgi:hypothetical protein
MDNSSEESQLVMPKGFFGDDDDYYEEGSAKTVEVDTNVDYTFLTFEKLNSLNSVKEYEKFMKKAGGS